MKSSGLRLSILLLTVFLAACAEEPPPPATTVFDHLAMARSGYEAVARGDLDGFRSLMDSEIVWHEAESLPYGGVFHGPDQVMENIFMAVGRDWSPYAAEPQRFIDGGDHITVLGEYRGIHQRSGGELQAPFAHVWRFENGLLVEFWQFTDTALWLAAEAGE